MAQDEGDTPELRGLAQRYYAHSFRLAAEAGDPELSATALRGRAVQCVDLGYRAEAVQLGEACVEYGRHLDNPRAVAYYEATLAGAAAQDDGRTMAIRHLARSETAIARSAAVVGDSWAAHYSPAAGPTKTTRVGVRGEGARLSRRSGAKGRWGKKVLLPRDILPSHVVKGVCTGTTEQESRRGPSEISSGGSVPGVRGREGEGAVPVGVRPRGR
ncbi:hypothetical protein GCM10010433_37980 [Streptomyces pulveraceus]